MTVRRWLHFLLGREHAILAIARDRSALWIGLLLVLIAGLAREYDAEFLVAEPWHLLLAPAVSFTLSLLLYVPLRLRADSAEASLCGGYRPFLSLFWMTAPLAWLYAIPYERFLSPGGAMSANLWTLAVVSLWRVLLCSRFVSVLTGRSFAASVVIVLTVANLVAQVALFFVPVPVIQFMGGVRLADDDLMLQSATLSFRFFGILAAPALLIAATVILSYRSAWHAPKAVERSAIRRSGIAWFACGVAAMLLLAMLITQREQHARWQAERMLRQGQIAQGLDYMSGRSPSAFPPHWDPPPRVAYHNPNPDLLDVLEVLQHSRTRGWARDLYLDKVYRKYGNPRFPEEHPLNEWDRVLSLLEKTEDRPALLNQVREARERVQRHHEYLAAPTTAPATTAQLQER